MSQPSFVLDKYLILMELRGREDNGRLKPGMGLNIDMKDDGEGQRCRYAMHQVTPVENQ